MLLDFLSTSLLLAADDDPNFLVSLISSLFLYGRVALGIGLVIFVHELGHFVAAKTFGVKCEKFYVGFDVPIRLGPIKLPRTLGKFRYGETEYGIGIIPLGGYVKMLGQDDDPRKQEEEAKRIQLEDDGEETEDVAPKLDSRSFPAKPVWQRMIIISAGVIMNVITGVLFAAIAYGYGVSYSPAIVGSVVPGGPAWKAGIEPGGKVISVGTWSDSEMHFREMKMEILTDGLENPDKPIDVEIQYDSGVRTFELVTQSRPDLKDARMIGIAIPNAPTIGTKLFTFPNSVAAKFLTKQDAGASIIAFDGTPINDKAIVPGTPFFDYLYSNPNKTIDLTLRRVDGSEQKVALPPQPAKSLGIRFAVGPIVGLVENGPAAEAGMKIGDIIQSYGDNADVDSYGMALDLVGATETVKVTVKRGTGDDAETVDLAITPSKSPQSIPPNQSIAGEIAINAVGFAYQPLPVISKLIGTSGEAGADENSLQVGDELKEVQLVEQLTSSDALNDELFEAILKQLREGWEISPITTLNTLRETIQLLPEGTTLKVIISRPPENKVITSTLVVRKDDRHVFERGLALAPSESIQQADSISSALALGVKEGYRRFTDVIRFLRMLPRGKIKLRHVGGPLEIVNIAKNEAEKGISPQLMFLTMLSMNLAILNFLPIPALDGGHMMFLIYELVAGKRANEQLEFRLTLAGILALLLLMAVVFANDIIRHL
ncbi:MAG: site-2 protease family protein [Rubripirellula sp.]|nr:site-2 protease family protein [Rubripirellula sp.]